MALLADAYAEAHLDLDPLDRDLAAAEAKILAAFERIEAAARIKVTLDTSGVDADLARLEARLKDQTINIDAKLNDASFAEVEAESAALQALWDDLNVQVDVQTTGVADAAEQLTGLEGIILGINASEATFVVDAQGVATTVTALTAVEGLKEKIDGSRATFQVNADGIAEVLAGAELIREFLRTIPNRIRTRFDFDGLAQALPELTAARLAIAAIPNKVRVVVDVDTSLFDRVRQAFTSNRGGGLFSSLTSAASAAAQGVSEAVSSIGSSIGGSFAQVAGQAGTVVDGLGGAFKQLQGSLSTLSAAVPGVGQLASTLGGLASSAFSLGLIVNLFGALASAIAVLIAYLVPLATGFLAAAAGLLAFGAAATVAVGAVGALAVLTAPGGLEGLAGIFENFKTTVQSSLGDILEPIREFLTSDVIARFTVSIVQAVGTLAPFFEGTVGPIIDALLRLIDTFGALSGPAALAVGAGIGKFIDTFTQFAAAINQDVVVEGVNALFDALNALLELLGETGVAFAPILNTLLSGFAGLTRGAIEPFLQIIGTFGQAIGPLGESFGNILRPLGDLTVVFGQFVAAVAPSLDTFFQLATLVIPVLNFELLTVVLERLGPVIADIGNRLGPFIDRVAGSFVQLAEALLTDANLESFQRLIESLIVTFGVFLEALANAGPLISGLFKFALDTGIGLVQVFNVVTANVLGLVQAVLTSSDTILGVLAEIVGLIQKANDLPGVGNLIPDELADSAGKLADGLRSALDGAVDWAAGAKDGFQSALDFSRGVDGSTTSLGEFDAVSRAGQKSLDEYAVKVETVAGSFELIGPAAGLAAQALAQVTASFPGTIKALDAFKKEFASGSLLKNALAAQQKAVQSQTQAAQKAAQASANAVKATVQSTLGGGRLSSFFQLSDIVPENAADQAREAAKRIQDGVKEFLGQGKLSDFLKDEKGNIDRALDSLVASLQVKAQNIARLRTLDSLGFSDLAVQLATLADSPKVLRKALDQLTAGGTAALSDANAKLGVGRRAIEAQLGGLSPALSAALGQAFGDDATDKVKKGSDNINQALDKLADGIRTRAENVKRLQQLQNLGFGDLALQLATLADDPAALNAALDQLAAGGVAALQRANGRLAGERANLEATMSRIDPALAQALGQSPGQETTAAVEEAGVNIFGALDALKLSFAQRLNNIGRLRFLEELGFTDLAGELATLDPDQLTTVLDQLGASGAEGIRAFNDQFITARDAAFAQAAALDPRTLEALKAGYPEVAAAVEEGLVRTKAQVRDTIRLVGAAGAVEGSQAGGAGATVLPKELIDQAGSFGEQYGVVIAESLETAAKSGNLNKRVQEALAAVFGGGSAGAFFPLQAVGEAQANSYLEGITNTIIGQGTIQIGEALTALLGNAAAASVSIAQVSGLTTGITYGTGFAEGIAVGAPVLAASLESVFTAVTVGTGAAALSSGLSAGLQLTAGLVEGSRLAGVLVGASLGGSLSTGLQQAAPAFIAATQRTIDLTATLAGVTATVRFALIGASGLEAFADAATRASARVANQLAAVFELVGIASGRAFGDGAQTGITESTRDLEVGFDLLIRLQPVLNTIGVALGTEFGVGFVVGLTDSLTFAETVAGVLALKVAVAVRKALDINSPSGVALELGGQFGSGLAIGLLRSTSEVEIAARALADAATVSLPQPDPIVVDVVPNVRGDLVDVLRTPTEAVTAAVPTTAPTTVAPTGLATQATLSPADIAAILLKLDAVVTAVAEIDRPLFGEYNVYGVERPQGPDQITRDAAFAKAVLS